VHLATERGQKVDLGGLDEEDEFSGVVRAKETKEVGSWSTIEQLSSSQLYFFFFFFLFSQRSFSPLNTIRLTSVFIIPYAITSP
jgi:hypothetical protein